VTSSEPPTTDERLPYEPPEVVGEDLFETLALACGKASPSQQSCVQVPRVS
jgi:hypothetical protein